MTRRPLQRARQWCARDPELLVTLVIAVGWLACMVFGLVMLARCGGGAA